MPISYQLFYKPTFDKNLGRTFFCFVTIHVFYRQTDGRTAFSWLDRVARNACSAVKVVLDLSENATKHLSICWHSTIIILYLHFTQ